MSTSFDRAPKSPAASVEKNPEANPQQPETLEAKELTAEQAEQQLEKATTTMLDEVEAEIARLNGEDLPEEQRDRLTQAVQGVIEKITGIWTRFQEDMKRTQIEGWVTKDELSVQLYERGISEAGIVRPDRDAPLEARSQYASAANAVLERASAAAAQIIDAKTGRLITVPERDSQIDALLVELAKAKQAQKPDARTQWQARETRNAEFQRDKAARQARAGAAAANRQYDASIRKDVDARFQNLPKETRERLGNLAVGLNRRNTGR
jgi:hypothetical protein